MRVLLIEDDFDVATNVGEYLEPRGVILDFAYDGIKGLELANGDIYSVVVLDLGLPGLNGIEVCRRLRASSSENRGTPILMLTARDDVAAKVEGFQAGADDYLVKPFALPELFHRLSALARRRDGPIDAVLRVGDLVLNPLTREVFRAGREIRLNRTDFRVLEILMRAAPRLVTRKALEFEIWGNDAVSSHLLRSYIYRLRQRIDKPFGSDLVQTVHGEGYRLRMG